MDKRSGLAAAALVIGLGVVGAGTVAAVGTGEEGEEGSTNVSDAQREAAIDAALAATDGGTANSVERDDENGATWEVEVTTPEGETVDVRLDASYDVVVIEGDTEDEGEGD